jgi:hypothetical protein
MSVHGCEASVIEPQAPIRLIGQQEDAVADAAEARSRKVKGDYRGAVRPQLFGVSDDRSCLAAPVSVSTRQVAELVSVKGMTGISKSSVSKLKGPSTNARTVFLNRPLAGEWPYFWLMPCTSR